MNVLIIIGILLLALVITVPLIERFGKEKTPEQIGKITRWIIPLFSILLLIQGLRYLFT